ncbi:MAG: ribonuclease E/G, partial [Pyrinomonadaceae bacterium]
MSCNGREKKIAILDNGKVTEFYIERGEENSGVVGNVYKGRVMRVLPGMQSAFVDIGLERDAFLYVSDFFDEEEEIERIVMEKGKKTSVEEATREVNERIDRSRIEREKQMESVQELAEPLTEATGDDDTVIDEPAIEAALTPQEEKPERGKRTRGGRGRKDRVEEPQAEAEPAPVIEIDYDNSGFERIADDDDTGDMFKDAYRQEAIIDRVRAVEFDMETIASAEVGTLLAEVAGDAGGFERIADEDDEAPAKGRKGKAAPKKAPAKAKAAKPAAAKAAAKGKTAKGKKAKADEGLEDAEASLKESDETAEMAVRRGGRGRRRGGKPKAKEAGDDSVEAVDGEESEEIVDTDAEQTEVAEVVEETTEIDSQPDAEPEAAPETSEDADGNSDEEKPRQDERPEREGRSRGGRGRGGRGRGGKTATDEQPADEQSAEKPSEERPSDDRPSRDRSNDRQSNDRPSRDRSQDRPSNDRPSGDRPSGDRPSGDRDRGGRGRGGRDRDRGPQPTISDLLKEGQEILVQIAKEPIAKKGARITSHIALPGRFLVYMPTIEHLGVSRKIESSSERSRLRGMLQRIRQDVAITTGGFIVRTAGIGISEEDLRNDAKFLVRTWADAKKDGEKRRSPAIVHQDLDLVQRLLRDQLSEDFTAIRVDSEEEYLRTVEFMNRMA